jgi:hypothetical protein
VIAVSVTIPEQGITRRFVAADEEQCLITLAKPCYGNPATRTVTQSTIDPKPERATAAWNAADAFAQAGMDANSRHSIDLLMARHSMSPLPPQQLSRILEYGAWWGSIWNHYGAVRARIEAGEDAHFDPAVPGLCPWTIWQIAAG